jgi:hypothetical protein
MTTQYKTRNLTADESAKLMRGLNLTLAGKTELVNSVLRVLADQGLGIFVAEAKK